MLKKFLPQIIAMLFLAGFAVFAWTEPPSAPPGGNVPAPINVGNTAQTKQGDLTIGGALKVEGNLLDNLGRTIYNAAIGKIDRARLPFEQGDITSDVDTNTYDAGYFDVSNLISGNVKNGITFGRGQSGALEPFLFGDSGAEGTLSWYYHSGWYSDGCFCWFNSNCSGNWYYAGCADSVPGLSERDPRNILNYQIVNSGSCWQGAPGNCKITSFPTGPVPYTLTCAAPWGKFNTSYCQRPNSSYPYCEKSACTK